MFIIKLVKLSPAGKLHKSSHYLTGSVSGTTEDEIWVSPVVISVLSTVTDDQEANSDLISKLSVYI